MDTKLLSTPESNNTSTRFGLTYDYEQIFGGASCLSATILFCGHCCLPLGTDFCNALFLHMHDKLLTLVAGAFLTQGKAFQYTFGFQYG
ncbi:hypothetical protein Tco_0025952 [Tanacetum coccineum]